MLSMAKHLEMYTPKWAGVEDRQCRALFTKIKAILKKATQKWNVQIKGLNQINI